MANEQMMAMMEQQVSIQQKILDEMTKQVDQIQCS